MPMIGSRVGVKAPDVHVCGVGGGGRKGGEGWGVTRKKSAHVLV